MSLEVDSDSESGSSSSVARVIDSAAVEEIRGPIKFFNDVAERTAVSGVSTGLAWTAVGGDILFIEATKMPGKGQMKLSGSLGDVMKESVGVASSFVRSMAAECVSLSSAMRCRAKFSRHCCPEWGRSGRDCRKCLWQ